MAVNKVVVNNKTILDLTDATATAKDIASGVTAYGASGDLIVGTASISVGYIVYGSNDYSASSIVANANILKAFQDAYVYYLKSETKETENTATVTQTATTNMNTYQGSINNILNSSTSTYWWSSANQTTGNYILITLSTPVTLTGVSIYSSNNSDYPGSNFSLQWSSNNSTWNTIKTLSNSQTNTYSGSVSNVRYVRIYCNSSKNNWLYINSFILTYSLPTIKETTLGLCQLSKVGSSYSWQNIDSSLTDVLSGDNDVKYVLIKDTEI